MFGNKYLYLTISSINIVCCVCYVNYELFGGFDPPTTKDPHHQTTHVRGNSSRSSNIKTIAATANHTNNATETNINMNSTKKSTKQDVNIVDGPTKDAKRKSKINIKEFRKQCPENEHPISLGTYEIPTQRDLVLFTKRTLQKMFNSYHEKTLYLLRDIKEATRATADVEKKCHGKGKSMYKGCVNLVSKKCVTITKELVASLERQKAEVTALTEDRICNLTSMKTDPIQLIKSLAMDEATLDFALPAFLRLLGECTGHCHTTPPPDYRPRLRQLTDQELVVKHFLTRRNYVQLINDKHIYV